MAKVHTAVKAMLVLCLFCIADKADAQSYGGCSYGASQYNKNTCKKAKTVAPPVGAIKLYPNPAGQFFMLQLPGDYSSQQVKVQVFSAQQKLVLTKTFTATVLRQKISLPLLANGLYQVSVSSAKTTQTILLNIQN